MTNNLKTKIKEFLVMGIPIKMIKGKKIVPHDVIGTARLIRFTNELNRKGTEGK